MLLWGYSPSAESLFATSWHMSPSIETALLTIPAELSECTATSDHSLVAGSLLRDGKL